MTRKTLLTLGAAASAALIAATALPALAGGWGAHDGWGPRQMMQMMHGDRDGFMQDRRGPGMMMRHGRMADNPVYQSFDADADGEVTPAELETGLAALHDTHDADGNGALSADEFAVLFAEVTRGMAARPFTMLDADGNGEISAEEMAFPAQMMTRMQRMHGADAEQQ